MQKHLHANRVLYQHGPKPGTRYRQIMVIEHGQFGVYIFEGDVIQTDPNFAADSTDAEVYLHDKLKNALEDAEEEFKKSVQHGWVPYEGGTI